MSQTSMEHGALPTANNQHIPGAGGANPGLDPQKAPPFPQAAFNILRNTQLRKNVAHATDVIQGKRNRLVAEKADWQELRSAASAVRAHVLENLEH
jgi:L-lactate dehydrogenase complex protein LldF